jgi:hypothetical protein
MLIFLLVLLLAGLAGFGYWAYSQGYLKGILKFGSDNATKTSLGAPVDTTPPVISKIEVTSKAIKEVAIRWATDKPSSSQVEWGPNGSFGNKTKIQDDPVTDKTTAGVVDHGVIVKGLTGNTKYQYRVISHTGGSADAISDTNTFTTPAE